MPPGSRIADEFRVYPVTTEGNSFAELLASVTFEDLGKGRRGAVLVRADEVRGVPIVRTTTRYAAAAQHFRPEHAELADAIQRSASVPVVFNNALVECYTDAYATMGAHSDQALDLAEASSIAVFSCYEHPPTGKPPRKLLVEPKEPGGERIEIPLDHESAVVFSVDANRRLRHRIVLDSSARPFGNRWLGVTFRGSKTFVRYRGGHAYLADDALLTLADDEQRREFYGLRKRENAEADFTYPRVTYTISESDLTPPEPVRG